MDAREQQFFEAKRAFQRVACMGHREKRAVLQEMRNQELSSDFVVVPAGVSLGSFCCMHLLNKRKSADDAADSDSDQ